MTQQELADASGLDIRYIGSIETGQRNPTFGALQGIASVFRDENVGVVAEGDALKTVGCPCGATQFNSFI